MWSYRFIWPKPGALGACLAKNGPKTARDATELARILVIIRVGPSYRASPESRVGIIEKSLFLVSHCCRAAGDATLAGVRLLNMFISAPSHHTLNLVHARAARMSCCTPHVLSRTICTSLITRMANRKNLPQFCIVATVSCFCYDEPYYYMM